MSKNQNIIQFPNTINYKKAKYIKIRDEVESLLFNYALKDLWAVSFCWKIRRNESSKIDGEDKAIDFLKIVLILKRSLVSKN